MEHAFFAVFSLKVQFQMKIVVKLFVSGNKSGAKKSREHF